MGLPGEEPHMVSVMRPRLQELDCGSGCNGYAEAPVALNVCGEPVRVVFHLSLGPFAATRLTQRVTPASKTWAISTSVTLEFAFDVELTERPSGPAWVAKACSSVNACQAFPYSELNPRSFN